MERKKIRIFLDSNVILSGLISTKGPPRILLDLLTLDLPWVQGITGIYNLEEIERNLGRFPGVLEVYRNYFSKINLEIVPLPPQREVQPLLNKMSPKDVPVLVSAKIAKSDYLVTGNKKDFPAKLLKPLVLLNPREMLEEISLKFISKLNR